MSKPKNVDSYINRSPKEARTIMEELLTIIISTIPEAEGGISWNVPVFKYHGLLAGFDVAKHHVSFGIDALQDANRKQLEKDGYQTGKKTIQIKFDQKVPVAMVRQLLLEQANINEMK